MRFGIQLVIGIPLVVAIRNTLSNTVNHINRYTVNHGNILIIVIITRNIPSSSAFEDEVI